MISRDALNQILARNKQLSIDENPSGAVLFGSQPQPVNGAALESSLQRAQESDPRLTVCFTGYRVRPCDPDNFAGGCKALLDGLRHAGLIPGDEPWRINFEIRQVKVSKRRQQRTEITIVKS